MFVARSAELSRLSSVVLPASIASGGQHVITVEGAIGIGKTTLVARFLDLVDGTRVIEGRPTEFERDVPLRGIARLLERLESGVDHLDEGASPRDLAERIAAALDTEPTLVVLDDAHWLDPESREVLLRLIRLRPAVWRALVIVYRSGQQPDGVIEAARRTGAHLTRISVPPLQPAELREVVGHLGDEVAHRVAERAAGNPLFAHLLADAALGSESVATTAESLTSVAAAPPTLHETLRGDIASLPSGPRSALQALAVPGSADIPTLSLLLGRSTDEVTADVDQLTARQLVVRDAAGLASVAHPLIRAAAYHGAEPGWRVELHRHSAALAASLKDRVEHLHHLRERQTPEESAAIVQGASRALGGSPRTAVRWLETTLHRADTARDLLLARAYSACGRADRAIELVQPHLDSPGHRAPARAILVSCLRLLGRAEEARHQLVSGRGLADDELATELAALAIMTDDWALVDEPEMRRLAAGDGDDPIALAARTVLALGLLNRGDVDAARPLAVEAATAMRDAPPEALASIVDAVASAAWSAYVIEEFVLSSLVAERGIAVARRYGRLHLLTHLHGVQAFALLQQGRLDEADAAVEDALAAAERYAWKDAVSIARLAGVLSALWRGDAEELAERWHALRVTPRSGVAWWQRTVEATMARVGSRLGERLDVGIDTTADAMLALRLTDAAQVAADRGDAAGARRLLEQALADTERTGLIAQRASVHLGLAGLLVAEGRLDEALALTAQAEAAFEARGMPNHRALASARLARLQEQARENPLTALTRREREVALLVVQGATNRRIAEDLVISVRTAEEHVSRILRKLQCGSRVELVSALSGWAAPPPTPRAAARRRPEPPPHPA